MTPRIYEEVVELIASEPTAAQVITFNAAHERFWGLTARSRAIFPRMRSRSSITLCKPNTSCVLRRLAPAPDWM